MSLEPIPDQGDGHAQRAAQLLEKLKNLFAVEARFGLEAEVGAYPTVPSATTSPISGDGTLRRRSQRDGMTWEHVAKLADAWLPKPRILHPWPSARFAVTHPRWEPGARIAHAGICAGGAR